MSRRYVVRCEDPHAPDYDLVAGSLEEVHAWAQRTLRELLQPLVQEETSVPYRVFEIGRNWDGSLRGESTSTGTVEIHPT